jgi:hypothetical protein
MMTIMIKGDDEVFKNLLALDGNRSGLTQCMLCTLRPVVSIRQIMRLQTPVYTVPCSLEVITVVV